MGPSLTPVLYQAFADGLSQLPRVLKAVPEMAKEQTGNRREIIAILNRLGDALEAAGDHVNVALSEQVLGYQKVSTRVVVEIKTFLRECSRQLRRQAIGDRLKKGHVCHELHSLYDEYGRFPSGAAVSGQGVSDWIRVLFGKSTKMRDALDLLQSGEQEYLNTITTFLQDVADEAETLAGSRLKKKELLGRCDLLVESLRQKRAAISSDSAMLAKQVERSIRLLSGRP